MGALAGNLDFIGSRFFTGLTAIFVTRLGHATAWQVRTFVLLIGRRHGSPFLISVVICCPNS
ncbi:hypothetical protein SBA7_290020 [Candidatus Sulfotelmatobacter sp. SbA7]|nr:hypothetical protein SBA7_290020 [Candidatus Sulfotelmatobacter sp. SbA7]